MDSERVDNIIRYAKPNERLHCEGIESMLPTQPSLETERVSVAEKKRRRDAIKERYRKATEVRLKQKAKQARIKVPYDDVYMEGIEWLDSLGDEPVGARQGLLHFSNDG